MKEKTGSGQLIRANSDGIVQHDIFNYLEPDLLKHHYSTNKKVYGVRSVCISPDNRYLAVTNEKNPISMYTCHPLPPTTTGLIASLVRRRLSHVQLFNRKPTSCSMVILAL